MAKENIIVIHVELDNNDNVLRLWATHEKRSLLKRTREVETAEYLPRRRMVVNDMNRKFIVVPSVKLAATKGIKELLCEKKSAD